MPIKLQTLLQNRFLRFLIVGGVNTLFGYGCFVLLSYAGLGDTLALLLATIAGVLFNFKTTGALVFESHNNRLILRFIVTYAVVYLVNISGLKTLEHLGMTSLYAAGIMLLPVAILAFFLNKRFVFQNA